MTTAASATISSPGVLGWGVILFCAGTHLKGATLLDGFVLQTANRLPYEAGWWGDASHCFGCCTGPKSPTGIRIKAIKLYRRISPLVRNLNQVL